MKVGIITQANQKGQIVIPKDIRASLGVDTKTAYSVILRGQGIYLYPITSVAHAADTENSYLAVLKQTKGAWQEDHWEETAQARHKIELKAAKKRKEVW